jgi:hypothetical protein
VIIACLHPGFVKSINDWQEHWINANDLGRLYGLRPNEWIAYVGDNRPHGYSDEFMDALLHLYPLGIGTYRHVNEWERQFYADRVRKVTTTWKVL